MPKASLIIAFYNKIDFLKLVLAGCERQTMKDFEVIIADDGSRPEIVAEINQIKEASPLNIQHIWHEDDGWRKNEMLNKAVVASKSDYLVFVDGDCIPHSRFIEEHYLQREENTCLTGRRVNLSQKISNQLNPTNIKAGFLENNSFKLIWDSLFGDSNQVEKSFYVKASWLRNFLNRKERDISGCNFSLHKKDLMNINGFDERYRAPAWGEDIDIHYRLKLKQVIMKSVLNICINYHLYHKKLDRESPNEQIFNEVVKEQKAVTDYGIIQSV